MSRIATLTLILFCLSTVVRAENEADQSHSPTPPPSLSLYRLDSPAANTLPHPRIGRSPVREFSYVPLPLIVTSFIVKSKKDDFRGARNNFIPEFHHELDNYLQYSPMALTLALKAAGVENRNQWGRMLASSALSYAAMAVLVNAAKYTIREQRPDGSSRNSFPSGHTATAFASATILHKEYGLTRSLWYSAAGYAVATGTGVMRVMNNRHWASDILAGAGIGIFSVDLGYFLSDLIFRDRYTLRPDKPDVNNFYTSPSFFNLSVGFGLLKQDIHVGDHQIRGSRAIHTQAELAYFITQNVGAGIRLSISSPAVSYKQYNDNMGIATLCAGAYFQLPLSGRFALGGKALVGRMGFSGFQFEDEASVEKSRCFVVNLGLNAAYAYRNNTAWRLNIDYDTSRVPIQATFGEQQYSTSKRLHQIALSGTMSIMF